MSNISSDDQFEHVRQCWMRKIRLNINMHMGKSEMGNPNLASVLTKNYFFSTSDLGTTPITLLAHKATLKDT